MLSLTISESSVRQFMNRLLREPLFDAFEARTADFVSHIRVSVSGALENETDGFIKWAELRPLITEITKAGGKPRSLKIVFSADSGVVASVHENAKALFLNLIYENSAVTFTTASAQKQFVMDKSLDAQWDAYIRAFFSRAGVQVFDRE